MRRTTAVLSAVIASAALVAAESPSSAITRGSYDGWTHPYVGAIYFPGTAIPTCSGVLVASKTRGVVLLTTAHCLVGYTKRRDVTVTFHPVADTSKRLTGTFIPDPTYRPNASDPHDLAVVVFDKPLAHRRLATLAPVGSVPRLLPTDVTTVGYGLAPGGVRKWATERATRIGGPWLYLRPVTGNSCYADSGGPDLLGTPTKPVVAALTDEGPCFGKGSFDKDYRVDTVAAHFFVDHV